MTATTESVNMLATQLLSVVESEGIDCFGIDTFRLFAKTMLECDQTELEKNPLFEILSNVEKNLVTVERLRLSLTPTS